MMIERMIERTKERLNERRIERMIERKIERTIERMIQLKQRKAILAWAHMTNLRRMKERLNERRRERMIERMRERTTERMTELSLGPYDSRNSEESDTDAAYMINTLHPASTTPHLRAELGSIRLQGQ